MSVGLVVRVSTILLFLRVCIVITWSGSVFGYVVFCCVVGSVVDDDDFEDVVVCVCGYELMNDDNVLGGRNVSGRVLMAE